MVGEVRSVLTRTKAPSGGREKPGNWLLLFGLGAFAAALGLYVIYMVIHPKSFTLDPVDLAVYRSGGLIVRHVRPLYNPRLAAPLYDWIGYGNLHLPFTYTPFAAIAFALISFVPWWLSQQLSVAVDIIALLAALWLTLGGLGYQRDKTRLGATLLGTAAVFWTEPVLRTIYLGQVNLVLMALIIWDLCQPDTQDSEEPLVEGVRHGRRGRHQAGPADLHPVPAAGQEVPAGCDGLRGLRVHRAARLRDPA